LLFSNPNSASARKRMTIKASLDEGMTWPRKLLLDEHGGAYSCLTQMDAKTVGILYESSQAQLLFQAIPIRDILRE
jgi:sialidase-1